MEKMARKMARKGKIWGRLTVFCARKKAENEFLKK
jgi:hypothetical protein